MAEAIPDAESIKFKKFSCKENNRSASQARNA
jgi:hypothetical protein